MNKPCTVSELNAKAKQLLESNFAFVWVQGEISNLMSPKSGHLYFTIKDQHAQISCVWLKYNHNQHTKALADGKQWWFKGKISLYQERGSFQLIVSYAQEFGLGEKQLLLAQKKAELLKSGWLDNCHKKPIPKIPAEIALVTSASGAAVHDMIKVIKRRMPATLIKIYSCVVQGHEAANSIKHAIELADSSNAQTIIVGRGGGSIEDLWAYNEDPVINAIFHAKTPIISGIGHESDNTLAELVADLRAATPSAAAESATQDIKDLSQLLDFKCLSINKKILTDINTFRLKLDNLQKNCKSPEQIIKHKFELIINYKKQMQTELKHLLTQTDNKLQRLENSIKQTGSNKLKHNSWQLAAIAQQLQLLSPLEVLAKGYAIVYNNNQEIIKDLSSEAANTIVEIKTKIGSRKAKLI